MPLQNRVTPHGTIVATPERGMLTGNRGIIHDPITRTLLRRRWTSRAWITCSLEWRGVRRPVMARRSWTELFFLDEATALAAGHRPCFLCRRPAALAFRAAWARAQNVAPPSAPAMDATLHRERRASGGPSRPAPALSALPDGTMVEADGRAALVLAGRTYGWTPGGYVATPTVPAPMVLITPGATVAALRAGYRPSLHDSLARLAPGYRAS